VVAIGGDGTISQVICGITLDSARRPLPPGPSLAILPAGTGGDYRRTFGLSEDADDCALRLTRTATRVDVGLAKLSRPDGTEIIHTFNNVLSFGVGGLTDQLVERGPKWLGGRAAFFLGAFAATLSYEPVPIELVLDGVTLPPTLYQNVAICVGRFFGGGMKIAPDADPSDGEFDVITIAGTRIQTLALSADIYRGAHLTKEHVHHYRAKAITAKLTRRGETLIDLDGEQPGRLPLSVSILPRALPLLI
jgi:diacylglycerol kinase family enzyme